MYLIAAKLYHLQVYFLFAPRITVSKHFDQILIIERLLIDYRIKLYRSGNIFHTAQLTDSYLWTKIVVLCESLFFISYFSLNMSHKTIFAKTFNIFVLYSLLKVLQYFEVSMETILLGYSLTGRRPNHGGFQNVWWKKKRW